MPLNCSTAKSGVEAPKTYAVGSLADTEKFLNCCPTASTLICKEVATCYDAIIAIPCRRWGCRYCGQRKAYGLAIRCELAAPTRFITLTVRPDLWANPRAAYDGTRRKLSDLTKKLKKQLGNFEYLRVLEATKKGWPHYHLAARCPYIQQREVSRIWSELTGAPIVDIRRIDKGVNVYKYMLKYLCKQAYVPWTNRRISWSRHFFPPPEKKEERPNPFYNRQRITLHPADALVSAYSGATIEQRRPGVWVITSEQTYTSNNQPRILEQEAWRKKQATKPSPICRPHSKTYLRLDSDSG